MLVPIEQVVDEYLVLITRVCRLMILDEWSLLAAALACCLARH